MTTKVEHTDSRHEPTRAATTLVLIVIVLVAGLSTTRSNGAPSVDPPVSALVLTPDAATGNEAPGLLVAPTPTKTIDTSPRQEIPPADDPAITAANVYALDASTGEALWKREADREVPIASTVKIATALVVVEHADLDDEVAIQQSDLVDYLVYSNMALIAGDVLTVEQLLHGLLIQSGSDAANALARHVGTILGGKEDPIGAFVDAMNDYAADLGLEHTHFTNPSGDHDPDAYSSARDIALLGAELMTHEALARIVGKASYSFTSAGSGTLYEGVTTNQILGENGVVGIKTGSTGEAGGCVILARETAEGLQIISVLGSDLVYEDNIIVLDARWNDARRVMTLLDTL